MKIAMGVGAAAMIPLVPAEVAAAAQRAVASGKTVALKFFTAAQHRTVDALTEVIIPTDVRSSGAKAARVADYLDFILNESSAEARQAWKDGLASLDAVSTTQFGKPFADLTAEQQIAIVTEAAKNEGSPTTPLEKRAAIECKVTQVQPEKPPESTAPKPGPVPSTTTTPVAPGTAPATPPPAAQPVK